MTRGILACLLLVACAEAEGPVLPTAEIDPLLIQHGADPIPLNDATVALHAWSAGGQYLGIACSGVLIADRWVLSAHYCVDAAGDPGRIGVSFGPDALDPAAAERAVSLHVQPGGSASQLSLVELPDAADVAPIPPLPADYALDQDDLGRPLDLSGYGEQEDGTYGVKQHILQPLDDLDASWITFDNGSGFGQGTGSCYGDGGGPSVVLRTGPFVAGIGSWGDADCNDYDKHGIVSNGQGWIESITGLVIDDPYSGAHLDERFTGTLADGERSGTTYTTAGPGVHDLVLGGTADHDLFLARRVDSSWRLVAHATQGGPVSVRHYAAGAGDYGVIVRATGGAGAYQLEVSRPQ